MSEEPSILDYLKSKLKFWEREGKIEIPDDEVEPTTLKTPRQEVRVTTPVLTPDTPDSDSVIAETGGLDNPPYSSDEKPERGSTFPWRSLLALLFALVAQRSWEPSPNRTAAVGLVFYAIALALLVWAILRKEWNLAPLPGTNLASDSLQVRPFPLILAFVLSLAAFLTLGGNLFTLLNVTLWITAILCTVWAFWLPQHGPHTAWKRLTDFVKGRTWKVSFTRITLLVIVIIAIVGFFRIYNLAGVPSQPNSDHAEKLLDVYDVSQGLTHIFFPRNTGREGIQMYLTLVVSWIFGTGITHMSLKIGTVIAGLLTLPYLYLLGKEYGNKRIGLLAVFFAGIAYWPNVISRFGLRFPLYPLFVAPVLYYLLRGLRNRNRNDFILSGLFLGFGLHGYTPMRIVPFIVVIAVGLYIIHTQSKGWRQQAFIWLVLLAVVSFVVFLPLARYWLDNPGIFSYRAVSRLGSPDNPLPGPAIQVFLSNTWNALKMFNWNDGETWVNSIVYRPALGVVSGALFILGACLVLVRYIRKRHWMDLFLLLSIPLLELPSILSLAYPRENPVLSRTGAAFIPAFLLVAMALDALLRAIQSRMTRRAGVVLSWVVLTCLAGFALFQNYDLVFHQYADQYNAGAWNSSEMGQVIKQFDQTYGTTDSVWIVAYPYWVDTRLPGTFAGIPNRDFAIWPQDFSSTLNVPAPKLFILKGDDTQDANSLEQLYPQGVLSTFHSAMGDPSKDFLILFVP
jgi:4-amino-4-deoxy-L-arabinose transferase-like glycosyltransferase